MSSDITISQSTVVAIQGNNIEAKALDATQDGYVLTWDNGDNQWEAKSLPTIGLQSQTFTTDGYWTCPANVFNVWLTGFGGGGGGSSQGTSGSDIASGGGGGGTWQSQTVVNVIPGNEYYITIGAGGLGGTGVGGSGTDGGNTTFDILATFAGASKALGGSTNSFGGGSVSGTYTGYTGAGYPEQQGAPSSGGMGNGAYGGYGQRGAGSIQGYSGGIPGDYNTPYNGGGGGGAGPNGNGAKGGNSNTGGAGCNGQNAADNSGAGGGGAGSGSSSGGHGGNGGSGQLIVSWIGV